MVSRIYIFAKIRTALSIINNFFILRFDCAASSILPELSAITIPRIINIQYISIIPPPRSKMTLASHKSTTTPYIINDIQQ